MAEENIRQEFRLKTMEEERNYHCVKSVHICSFSGPNFSTFELNTERYGVSDHRNYEYGHFSRSVFH